jgi:hypothetical protein
MTDMTPAIATKTWDKCQICEKEFDSCPDLITLFADEEGRFAFPLSLLRAIYEHREPPHIDYYVGRSSHTSPEKEKAIQLLKALGARWSWECEECHARKLWKEIEDMVKGVSSTLKDLTDQFLKEIAQPPPSPPRLPPPPNRKYRMNEYSPETLEDLK